MMVEGGELDLFKYKPHFIAYEPQQWLSRKTSILHTEQLW